MNIILSFCINTHSVLDYSFYIRLFFYHLFILHFYLYLGAHSRIFRNKFSTLLHMFLFVWVFLSAIKEYYQKHWLPSNYRFIVVFPFYVFLCTHWFTQLHLFRETWFCYLSDFKIWSIITEFCNPCIDMLVNRIYWKLYINFFILFLKIFD